MILKKFNEKFTKSNTMKLRIKFKCYFPLDEYEPDGFESKVEYYRDIEVNQYNEDEVKDKLLKEFPNASDIEITDIEII